MCGSGGSLVCPHPSLFQHVPFMSIRSWCSLLLVPFELIAFSVGNLEFSSPSASAFCISALWADMQHSWEKWRTKTNLKSSERLSPIFDATEDLWKICPVFRTPTMPPPKWCPFGFDCHPLTFMHSYFLEQFQPASQPAWGRWELRRSKAKGLGHVNLQIWWEFSLTVQVERVSGFGLMSTTDIGGCTIFPVSLGLGLPRDLQRQRPRQCWEPEFWYSRPRQFSPEMETGRRRKMELML